MFSFPSAENDTFACIGSTDICVRIFFPVWLQRVCDQFSSPGRLDCGVDHDLGTGLHTEQGRSVAVGDGSLWAAAGTSLCFDSLGSW